MADEKKAAAVAADKAAADKATTEKSAFLAGAEAVAAAVNKVADAAVNEIKKTPATDVKPDLVASGVAGGKIRIIGTGFGSSGTVLLNGMGVRTNGWSTTSIEGVLPADAKSGVLEVVVDPETVRRGYLTLTP